MSSIDIPLKQAGFGQTARKDTWWREPLLVFLGYLTFLVYATWACAQGAHYQCTTNCAGADYLSPFYSPLIFTPRLRPGGPASCRFRWACWSCRSPASFASPVTTIAGLTTKPFGLTRPLVRWASPAKLIGVSGVSPSSSRTCIATSCIFAIALIVILLHDGWKSLWFTGADGATHFGIGVGSLVLILNPILLGLYTFSCR